MELRPRTQTQLAISTGILLVALGALLRGLPASAQVLLSPGQFDRLVAPIALYPDPLLVQVLSASTYPEEISDASEWADQHDDLIGGTLANAIGYDNLPWHPSVVAILPFPSVLAMMATKESWTRELGDAILGQKADVMDAVQRVRQKARSLGYLLESPQYHVVESSTGIIEILPVDPASITLPIYDSLVVFERPRSGLSAGITFASSVELGPPFATWGWGNSGFEWPSHRLFLDGQTWTRTLTNRDGYIHPYTAPRYPALRNE